MRRVRLGPAEVVFTGRQEGDLGHAGEWVERPAPEVEARRRAVLDRPWSWLRQVHASRVVVVEEPGGGAGESADAAVSRAPGTALVVFTADCAPVALASDEGVIGAVHAGWRGLAAGVLDEAVAAMRGLGATGIVAALGPCIHAECYEFGEADLAGFPAEARATTSEGKPALDVPEAVRLALRQADVELVFEHPACTACSPEHFSYRARAEMQRQAMVVWMP